MIFDTIFVEAENDDVGETDLRVTNARGLRYSMGFAKSHPLKGYTSTAVQNQNF